MARPKIHDEASGEALLDAALELLRQGGPAAVSVRAAADASGVSFRAVYSVFGSKQALIDALAERGYRDLTARVLAVPEGDPVQELVDVGLHGFRSFAMGEPELFRLTFERISPEVLEQERVREAAYASYAALAHRVRRAKAAGVIRADLSDEVCVYAFHSLCQGLASSELAAAPPPRGPGFWPMLRGSDLETVWREALTALVTGLADSPPG